jgi:hypothetical protein
VTRFNIQLISSFSPSLPSYTSPSIALLTLGTLHLLPRKFQHIDHARSSATEKVPNYWRLNCTPFTTMAECPPPVPSSALRLTTDIRTPNPHIIPPNCTVFARTRSVTGHGDLLRARGNTCRSALTGLRNESHQTWEWHNRG